MLDVFGMILGDVKKSKRYNPQNEIRYKQT